MSECDVGLPSERGGDCESDIDTLLSECEENDLDLLGDSEEYESDIDFD